MTTSTANELEQFLAPVMPQELLAMALAYISRQKALNGQRSQAEAALAEIDQLLEDAGNDVILACCTHADRLGIAGLPLLRAAADARRRLGGPTGTTTLPEEVEALLRRHAESRDEAARNEAALVAECGVLRAWIETGATAEQLASLHVALPPGTLKSAACRNYHYRLSLLQPPDRVEIL